MTCNTSRNISNSLKSRLCTSTSTQLFRRATWHPHYHRETLSSTKLSVRFFSHDSNRKKAESSSSKPTTIQSVWQQIQSPPNAITVARLACTPVLAYWITSGDYHLAIGGCTIAATSDFLDGWLAKHYGWTTVLGTYLDPLADKVFVNTLAASLWYSDILPTPIVAIWASKDIILLSGTAWFLYKKHGSISILRNSVAKEPLKVNPSMLAKVNTALQFSTLVAGLMTPVVSMPPIILNSLCWITAGTSVGTVLSYATKSGVGASVLDRLK